MHAYCHMNVQMEQKKQIKRSLYELTKSERKG